MADEPTPESVLAAAARGEDAPLFALAEARQRAWDLAGAEALLQAAHGLPVDQARVHFQSSILAMQQGFADEAFAHAARAEALAPMARAIRHHALTLEKLREPQDPAAFLAAHRRFGADFSGQEANLHLRVARPLDPERPLRVAYVTPDAHLAMARFVGCLYRGHDPARVQARFYHAFARDAASLAALPGQHVALGGMDSEQVAQRLLRDAPDLIVDLAGHGAGNQLLALMRRPAPLQLSWLDYVATTGVPALDARIGDAHTDPEGSERWSTEAPLRLAVSPWCYEPHPQAPPLRADLSLRSAPLRLGACCVPLKLGDGVLRCWRALLEALPEAELVLLGVPEGRARARLRAAFAGLDPARLRIEGRLALPDFYRAIDAFDLALDPFPFSGATATLDCLWQGVPVVTLPGVLPHSRSSASLLAQAGLADWIARDAGDYVAIARRLARDETARLAFRRDARTRLAGTSLIDAARFVPALEDGLREAWHSYVATRDDRPARLSLDNALAERRAQAAREAQQRGEPAAAHAASAEALRQLPAWAEPRQVFWATLPRPAAGATDAPSAALGRIALVLLGEGPAPLWAAACRSVQRHDPGDAPLGSRYAQLAQLDAEFVWVLSAAHEHWWLDDARLPAWLDEGDAFAAFGERNGSEGRQACGVRLQPLGDTFVGRAWPVRAPQAVDVLPDACLLLRRELLVHAAEVTERGSGHGAALRLRAWHAELSAALHARGARLRCVPGALALETLSSEEEAGLARWQHARLADGATRRRVDVGRVFATRDAATARMLLRGLFA
jgi:predicted O-linked N-acetylglucosamine transferase (SPINDLY family)